MARVKVKYLAILFVCFSCNDDNEFSPENLDGILSLSIDNNNAVSDGIEEIEVIAEFPIDFSTETDGMVDFTIFKQPSEVISRSIEIVQENGVQEKQSSILINSNKADSLRVEATISVNAINISKEVFIHFSKAYLTTINIKSSSLTIQPNSFNEIEITTELLRDSGIVTLNSIAETVVVDTLGQVRGIFNGYQNKTNNEGKIVNNFTLGNDDYQGRLFVIGTSADVNNVIKSDTLTIFSQN
ncbi:hypothetical protein [uncultured Croceitalea sp.]|uniref:hypothetical protein n=1 Tax=uncultured Croceitalea sp. TaxID=1798908 RepID=UPI003305E06F